MYKVILTFEPPPRPYPKKLAPVDVLLDTGASIILIPLAKAKDLGAMLSPRNDIVIKGVNGHPIQIESTTTLCLRDQLAT